jgi:hypothetical protein
MTAMGATTAELAPFSDLVRGAGEGGLPGVMMEVLLVMAETAGRAAVGPLAVIAVRPVTAGRRRGQE